MNSPRAVDAVNRLTGQNRDSVTHTPAYKDTSVRMEALGELGEDPLPRSNPRNYHPTSQLGVEVQKKWAQPGYSLPGTSAVSEDRGPSRD